jgi:long-chain acyl-CoA synthetase
VTTAATCRPASRARSSAAARWSCRATGASPELTAQTLRDGWVYSGDIGHLDDEGYLYLVDRKKDMIDSGGVKVYPRDIEDIAARHPAIADVAVFGIPHETRGETPLAAVVLKVGADATAANCATGSTNGSPRATSASQEVVILSDFPRSAAGKTLKRELREPWWAGRATKI